jgi:hypothetical protein
MMNTEQGQQRRTAKATAAAAMKRKNDRHAKMARELQEAGWYCARTGQLPRGAEWPPPPGTVLLATNGLGETYVVAGWRGADPMLVGIDGVPFTGLQNYLFTVMLQR